MHNLPRRESLTVEFKSVAYGKNIDSSILEAVVAMANTEGGTIFLGVEDDGSVSGVDKAHSDPEGAAAMIANRTAPPVVVDAAVLDVGGKGVMRIEVPQMDQITSITDSRVYRRRLKLDGTPENVPMLPYEYASRLSEIRAYDLCAQIVPSATVEDFDGAERGHLRQLLRLRRPESGLLDLSDEELDSALRLTARDHSGKVLPTFAGLLMIGKEESLARLLPSHQASFQALRGSRVAVNIMSSKPLLAVLDLFETTLSGLVESSEIAYGLQRIPAPEYNPDAFREALVNAFCHRDYSRLGRVRVELCDEGLSVTSAGGFVEGVTISNLMSAEPRGRNPSLAYIFVAIGLAESTGRGVDRILAGQAYFGRPLPDYSESTSTHVRVVFPKGDVDEEFVKMELDEVKRSGKEMSPVSVLVLSALRTRGPLTSSGLRDAVPVSQIRLEGALSRLVANGLVLEERGKSETVYTIRIGMRRPESPVVGETPKRRILEYAKTKGGVFSRGEAAFATGLSDSTAYRALSGLVAEGLLESEGEKRGRVYRYAKSPTPTQG